MLKVQYVTFGCKLNFSETATLESELKKRGVFPVESPSEHPDIIVVNTCSVTEVADKKCRQTIRSFARRYPDAAIVVTGCYAQLKPAEASALPGVVIVAGNDHKKFLIDYICEWIDRRRPRMEVADRNNMVDFVPSCSRGDRTRYFLKVQDGCDYGCSYCTIPRARGASRSGSIDLLVEQAAQVAAAGGKEIVITGVNIGDFGRGRTDTFFDLIRELDRVEGIERYRISSIEPNLLTDSIVEWVATSRAFMPHFHIPLQCGDDTVLALMRRRYNSSMFARKIDCVNRNIPDAFIGVDLIVGARGETPELFENSRRFVESLNISQLHVFPYSERPGTRAVTDIPYVVSQEEKHRRAAIMGEVSSSKLLAFRERFIGTTRPVLIEHTNRNGIMSGFTDNYIRVALPADSQVYNTVIPVTLSSENIIS